MTEEEAAEEVLKGPDKIECQACNKGRELNYCHKCHGTRIVTVVSFRYIRALHMMGLPPWKPQ